MASIGLAPGLVIGLREGIEAALIIGVIIAYLTKTNQRKLVRYVLIGLIAAVFASLVVAGALIALSVSFEGFGEELFEGIMAIIAVIVLTFMIFWMMRAANDIRGHFENRLDGLTERGQLLGLVGLTFVAVFREGVETALFMLGVAGATTTTDAVAGVAIGILIAAFIGLALPRISIRISLRRFFQVTSILLIVIAAGLLASGVHELQEAFEVQVGSGQIYNLQGVFSSGEDNPLGYLLHGIVGYSDSPSQLEAFAYFVYLAVAIFLWWHVAFRKSEQDTKEVTVPVAVNPEPSLESGIAGSDDGYITSNVATDENIQ